MKHYFIIATAPGYGGAEKSLELIIKGMSKLDCCDITVFAENDKHIEQLKTIKKIKVIQSQKGKGALATFLNLCIIFRYLLRYPDCFILCNTNKSAMYLALISLFYPLNQKRIIFYIQDFQWKCTKFIITRLNKAKIAVPSQAVPDNSKYNHLLKKRKVYATGVPVEIPILNDPKQLNPSPYILCLANISRWKGIDYLIKSYFKSHLWSENIRLLIVGKKADQACFNELIKLIDRENMQKYVIFKDFEMNTEKLYMNCLFVANSSISEFGGPETFGRTIIEAWSYHKAAISFDAGGPKFLINNNFDGILVPEKNVDLYAKALRDLALDEPFRTTLADNGYKKVKNEFTTKALVEKLMIIWNKS